MTKRQRIAYASSGSNSQGSHFSARIPKNLVEQLQKIWKNSNKERREISGVVPITSVTPNQIRFGPVERKRIGERGGVSMNFLRGKGKREYNISFHTHPNPPGLTENVFTIPSVQDIELYMNEFPQTQVNLVLDGSGIFVVDYNPIIPRNIALEKYEKVFKTLERMQKISKESINGKSPTDFLYWTDTKENINIAMTDMREFLSDVGLNIRYYFYENLDSIPFQFDNWTGENINKVPSPVTRNDLNINRRKIPINKMNINTPPPDINKNTFMNLLDKWQRLFGIYENGKKANVIRFMKRKTNNKYSITPSIFANHIAINSNS